MGAMSSFYIRYDDRALKARKCFVGDRSHLDCHLPIKLDVVDLVKPTPISNRIVGRNIVVGDTKRQSRHEQEFAAA